MRFLRFAPASFLLAVVLTVLFGWKPFSPPEDVVWVEIPLESSAPGVATLQSWSVPESWGGSATQQKVSVNRPGQILRFPIPGGPCLGMHFYPLDRPGRILLGSASIVDADGKTLWTAPLDAWKEISPSGLRAISKDRIGLELGQFNRTPSLQLQISPNRSFSSGRESDPLQLALIALGLTVLLTLVGERFQLPLQAFYRRTQIALRNVSQVLGPVRTLAVVAIFSVMASCFPTLFLGKSIVSPKTGALSLYETYPTVPGIETLGSDAARGSDTLAIQVAHIPYSSLTHEAVFEKGEFPLWNRYNSCGSTLIGQMLPMFGDPLHWITVAADGAPWAWDTTFLIARWLFALGVGIAIWKTTGQLGIAALVGFSINFIGFFTFRLSHPAAFSICYAPWILVAWQSIATAKTGRSIAGWMLGLTLACTMELNSGTAKESVILIGGLNTTGALIVLFSPIADRARRLAAGICACVAFVLINAPFWLLFLDALKVSFSVYAEPPVIQIPPAALLGLFDDTFFHRLTAQEFVSFPAANFLILAGLALGFGNLPAIWKSPTGRALIITSAGAFAFAFGLVPASFVRAIPFVKNISHVGNTFSHILIVQFAILAAMGLVFWMRDEKPSTRALAGFAVSLGTLAVAYYSFAGPLATNGQVAEKMPAVSPFFQVYSLLLLLGAGILPTLLHWVHKERAAFTPLLATACVIGIFTFRHAQLTETKFDYYVINPQDRTDNSGRSPAVESLRPLLTQPARVAGIRDVLMPGYNAALRLENICSADPMTSRRLREFLDASPIQVVWDWRVRFMPETLANTQKFSDMLNVRYFLAPPGAALPQGFNRLSVSDLEVWESPTAWPRAFFTDDVATYQKPADLAAMVATSSAGPFAAVQQPEKPNRPPKETRTVTSAKNVSFSTNATTCEIEAPSAGMLVLSETWLDDDIVVTLNGQPATPVRVNHTFRGVELPSAGHYVAEFRYRPKHLALTLWMSAAGAALSLLACAILFRTQIR